VATQVGFALLVDIDERRLEQVVSALKWPEIRALGQGRRLVAGDRWREAGVL
jgi:hypothetical protein